MNLHSFSQHLAPLYQSRHSVLSINVYPARVPPHGFVYQRLSDTCAATWSAFVYPARAPTIHFLGGLLAWHRQAQDSSVYRKLQSAFCSLKSES